MRSTTRHVGMTLVELLVVIAIIALLMAILMPVVRGVRRAGRATACLATLHDWGNAYQAYVSANRGHSLSSGPYPTRLDLGMPQVWWELLRPHHPEVTRSLLCPEATEGANGAPTSAFQPWGPEYLWDSPGKVRGSYIGSYGINDHLLEWLPQPGEPPPPSFFPRQEPSRIPLIFDCAAWHLYAANENPPTLYLRGAPLWGITLAALERHWAGTQIVFVDGHADYVPTAELWKLRWSSDFIPRDVQVKR
ncbi:MAG TPA: type II secretion system protein [Tepidisphaeraceae bacterium]